jgi:uncharacterized repeat protein (TIGR01451 family)
VVTCELGDLADGASVDVTVVVETTTYGTLTNEVSVGADTGDPDEGNNGDSEETTVERLEADLRVSKEDEADPVAQGEEIVYTVTVTNLGPDAAEEVVVTDDLPGGVTYVSATPGQGSCEEAGGVVTCELGEMANGASVDVEIVVETVTYGTLTNGVSVSASTYDPEEGNNGDSEETTVNATACDLEVSVGAAPDPVTVGGQVTYTIEVHNYGPGIAAGVVVTDELPVEVAYVTATAGQGSCSETGGVVRCELGSIGNGENVEVEVVVETEDYGTVMNVVEVTSNSSESNVVNNSASAPVTIEPIKLYLPVVWRVF